MSEITLRARDNYLMIEFISGALLFESLGSFIASLEAFYIKDKFEFTKSVCFLESRALNTTLILLDIAFKFPPTFIDLCLSKSIGI